MLDFEIVARSGRSAARAGRLRINGRTVETPAFFPVGTQGTVKGVAQKELLSCGVQGMLCNLYHLYLRPGIDLVEAMSGIHRFINWDGLIITDSGGFQVYSLESLRKIEAEGVHFVSHLDGSSHFFTPENVIQMQMRLGSDVAMVLDECVGNPATFDYARNSMNLTLDWAERSAQFIGQASAIFGIVQGATFPELRSECAVRLREMNFDGYAIGGLAVGESKETMFEMVKVSTDELPPHKPRYLMGVGFPLDIAHAVAHGVDIFDCVMPTRNARNGSLFVDCGKIVIKNAQYSND
ncbi:MAG: tRNA guanosine(34) transglycosylase Tgt, partial [Candidatus Coatesbacteria bacterium]|nr:tRNA guanosine(34) transglycosylase Tgt [Candidatus Coatesbacteria bacterium]